MRANSSRQHAHQMRGANVRTNDSDAQTAREQRANQRNYAREQLDDAQTMPHANNDKQIIN